MTLLKVFFKIFFFFCKLDRFIVIEKSGISKLKFLNLEPIPRLIGGKILEWDDATTNGRMALSTIVLSIIML